MNEIFEKDVAVDGPVVNEGEGYRKVWARLRVQQGIRVTSLCSGNRVRYSPVPG
jgi:hypothetical protein